MNFLNRRGFLLGSAAVLASQPVSSAIKYRDAIDLHDLVVERAKTLAGKGYVAPQVDLPPALRELNYDTYHQIKFRPERSVWHGDEGGFELQGLHRGFLYDEPVELNVVDNGAIRAFDYDPSLFSFGKLTDMRPESFGAIGYSGFRVLTEVDRGNPPSELFVFQGASYFRAVAPNVDYGLSARGLAIRTGDARGEEFPRFTAFYIERPEPGSQEIRVHALMDSPSVTGAFSFTIVKGSATRMSVRATLFARVDLDNVGLAPLTSMYWYGPLERPPVDDFRPRIHDSDGLAMQTEKGEWIFRALANPARLQHSLFDTGKPRGFGLAQRRRELRDFEDMQARYHRRPSLWITPGADWPSGSVELVEIPTGSEFNDNIVAYWRLADTFRAGARLDYDYEMRWAERTPDDHALLLVRDSYSGSYARTWRHFVIDFAPGKQMRLPNLTTLKADVSFSAGRIEGLTIIPYPEINGFRVTFRLEPEGDLSDLRAVVRREDGMPVTETWSYRWTRRG